MECFDHPRNATIYITKKINSAVTYSEKSTSTSYKPLNFYDTQKQKITKTPGFQRSFGEKINLTPNFLKGREGGGVVESFLRMHSRYFSEVHFIRLILCILSGSTQHGLDSSRSESVFSPHYKCVSVRGYESHVLRVGSFHSPILGGIIRPRWPIRIVVFSHYTI